MKKLLRHFGAFFLSLNLGLAFSASPDIDGVDYSINIPDTSANKDRILFNYTYQHNFPVEVLDFKDNSIRFKNVEDDPIPLISLGISIISFLSAIAIPIIIDHRNRKKSILDDFWARQVVFPEFIKPAMDFSNFCKFDILSEDLDKWSDKFNSEFNKQLSLISQAELLTASLGIVFDNHKIYLSLQSLQDFILVSMSDVEDSKNKQTDFNFTKFKSDRDLKIQGYLKSALEFFSNFQK